jgi:hypothetical protein
VAARKQEENFLGAWECARFSPLYFILHCVCQLSTNIARFHNEMTTVNRAKPCSVRKWNSSWHPSQIIARRALSHRSCFHCCLAARAKQHYFSSLSNTRPLTHAFWSTCNKISTRNLRSTNRFLLFFLRQCGAENWQLGASSFGELLIYALLSLAVITGAFDCLFTSSPFMYAERVILTHLYTDINHFFLFGCFSSV